MPPTYSYKLLFGFWNLSLLFVESLMLSVIKAEKTKQNRYRQRLAVPCGFDRSVWVWSPPCRSWHQWVWDTRRGRYKLFSPPMGVSQRVFLRLCGTGQIAEKMRKKSIWSPELIAIVVQRIQLHFFSSHNSRKRLASLFTLFSPLVKG